MYINKLKSQIDHDNERDLCLHSIPRGKGKHPNSSFVSESLLFSKRMRRKIAGARGSAGKIWVQSRGVFRIGILRSCFYFDDVYSLREKK